MWDRLLGLLSSTLGQPDQADAHFAEAITTCRRGGYLVELAWALYERAELLARRGGHNRTVVPLVEESAQLAAALQLAPLVERMAALRPPSSGASPGS